MGRRKCCCGEKVCVIDSDGFGRGNSTNLGNTNQGIPWVEKFGDWLIDTNELTETGTAGAVVVTERQLSRPSYNSFKITNITSGAKPRVVAGYHDLDNYFFVEIEVSGPFVLEEEYDYTLKLYKRIGGADGVPLLSLSLKGEWPADGFYIAAIVYLTEDYFTACGFPDTEHAWPGAKGAPYWVCDPGLFPGQRQVGFGNGGTDPVSFDNWGWWNMWEWAGDEWLVMCGPCQCLCGRGCIPMTLNAELINNSGCPDIGKTIQLEIDRELATWKGDDGNVCPVLQVFELICPDSEADRADPTNFELLISPMLSSGGGAIAANEGSTCDPLWLEFGPISGNYQVPPAGPQTVCGENCDVFDGTFMVEITEP